MAHRLLLALALVIGLIPALVPSGARQAEAAMGIRWGYYTGYDKTTSYPSLKTHIADLNYVSPWFGYGINKLGEMEGQADLEVVSLVRSSGAKLVPLVQNGPRYANFHTVISSPSMRTKMVNEVVDLVTANRFDGVNIDFEAITATDRPYLTMYMQELYGKLRPMGKLVTMALPAKTFDATTGWAGAYDYKALAPYSDRFMIMAYDYSSPDFGPGPVAPVDWVRSVTQFAGSQLGFNKVIVGLPSYGYDWNVTTGALGKSIKYQDIAALQKQYGAVVRYDTATQSVRATYSVSGQTHEVWAENGRSFNAKLAVARELGAAGVGMWRLGSEDPRVWNSIRGLSVGVSLATFSPNADGYQDSVSVSYRIDVSAQVQVDVLDSTGRSVRNLQPATSLTAGARSVAWNGRDSSGARVADGRYTVRVLAWVGGSPVTDTAVLTVHTPVRYTGAWRGSFSPRAGALAVGYSVDSAAYVYAVVEQSGRQVKALRSSSWQRPGSYVLTWDGLTSTGAAAPDGGYTVRLMATNAGGRTNLLRDFYLDRTAPAVTNAAAQMTPFYVNGATQQVWRYYLSEMSSIRIEIRRGGVVVQTLTAASKPAGRNVSVWNGYIGGALASAGQYTYSIVAVDPLGNTSAPATGSFSVTR